MKAPTVTAFHAWPGADAARHDLLGGGAKNVHRGARKVQVNLKILVPVQRRLPTAVDWSRIQNPSGGRNASLRLVGAVFFPGMAWRRQRSFRLAAQAYSRL